MRSAGPAQAGLAHLIAGVESMRALLLSFTLLLSALAFPAHAQKQ